MTLNGAIMELVMLSEHPIMPVIFKPSIQKIIETVSECEEPQERKTGKWIHDGSHWANRWICDKCGYKLFGAKTKFCPDCGQRMEVDT